MRNQMQLDFLLSVHTEVLTHAQGPCSWKGASVLTEGVRLVHSSRSRRPQLRGSTGPLHSFDVVIIF